MVFIDIQKMYCADCTLEVILNGIHRGLLQAHVKIPLLQDNWQCSVKLTHVHHVHHVHHQEGRDFLTGTFDATILCRMANRLFVELHACSLVTPQMQGCAADRLVQLLLKELIYNPDIWIHIIQI